MKYENLEYGSDAEPFDLTGAIEKDPIAQWLLKKKSKLFLDPDSEQYNNMLNFINWLKVNKPEVRDTLYFHILIGSGPFTEPKAADLDGEYSIEKFVKDGFPEKDLKNLK